MPVGTWERTLPVRTSRGGPEPAQWQPCRFCGKPAHATAEAPGWNVGDPEKLGSNILRGAEPESHPWYTGRRSIAAHHLICSESMADDEDWSRYCWLFGYDINKAENGVFLPMKMAVACELHVPVHRGPHSNGWAFDLNMAYPSAVVAKLEKLAESVEAGAYCGKPARLVEKLDRTSKDILDKLSRGSWTITADGLDYLPGGKGCGGVRSISDKPVRACPNGRRHGVRHGTTKKPLSRRPLQVGA
ncbi:AHH domain-containing protein [Myxococcus sp. CA039A]|nr:AHH domain-containing protein [Myxococcus sp. CA039A]NTX54616.1 AHH domain-containing protein [Myxococcus sp. CA039A]